MAFGKGAGRVFCFLLLLSESCSVTTAAALPEIISCVRDISGVCGKRPFPADLSCKRDSCGGGPVFAGVTLAGMTYPSQPPIDTSVPHSARVWNYWLGGKDNYPVDREAGEQFLATFPGIAQEARAARAFLMRAVRYLTEEAGVRQFLDIGTGLPTADNTHEVAQTMRPDARIVYVDNDPLVLTHARALLTSTEEGYTDYLHAGLEEPEEILAAARERLDFDEPVGLIIIGVLAHVADYGRAKDIVRTLLEALPSDSHLVLSDGTHSHQANVEAQEDYNESGAVAYNLRSKEEIAGFFEGVELVDPGLTTVTRWRCEDTEFGTPPEVDGYGGVGRKA